MTFKKDSLMHSRHTNIVLVGMPGAGKSTIGRALVKRNPQLGFVDTDHLIEAKTSRPLQSIVDNEGYLTLREYEQQCLIELDCRDTVISTGGSAIYSEAGMSHLENIGTIFYLELPLEVIRLRVGDYGLRGLAKPPGQSFDSLYRERHPLYLQYANIALSCENLDIDAICTLIEQKYPDSHESNDGSTAT